MKAKRIKFKDLTDQEMKNLLSLYSLKEIGMFYDINPSGVSYHLSSRKLFRPNKKEILMSRASDKYLPIEEEVYPYDTGSWMDSEFRIAIKQFDKI